MATDANQCRSFWCLQFSVSSEGDQEHSRTPASQFGPFLCICSLETPRGRTLWEEAHGPRGPSYGAFWQVGLTSGFCSVVPTLALVLHSRVKEGPQARCRGVGRGERQPLPRSCGRRRHRPGERGVDTAPSANLGLELSSRLPASVMATQTPGSARLSVHAGSTQEQTRDLQRHHDLG